VGIFADRPLLSAPGTAYEYSSWGYTLLGAMVEAAAGERFIDHVPRVIAPGLDIGADATDGDDPRASVAYEFSNKRAKRAPRHDFSYTWGGGGLMGSAQGVARFGGAMLADRIVSRRARTVREMPPCRYSTPTARRSSKTTRVAWARVRTSRLGRVRLGVR